MKTNKISLAISAALIMAVSVGVAKAEDTELTKTRTQEQIRTEANIQAPNNEAVQARLRVQKMEQLQKKKAQVRNEYQKKIETRQSTSGSMMRQNMVGQSRSTR